MKKILSLFTALLFAGSMAVEAATSTTVYYAVPSSVVGSYTLKLNVNRKGDGNDWATYTMTNTGKTYNSNPIYSCSFTDLYNGLGALQFQLYSGNTWKSQVQPISSWTTVGTYNNKMWVYGGSSWISYTYDVPPVYTVVGEVPGLSWDQTSSTNDMTGNNSVYTRTLTDVELVANTPYNYKMVKNHSWDVSYPQSGNANFSVAKSGIYDITFTLDLSASPEYSVVPTLKQEIVVIPTVKMSGTFAGSTWTETDEFEVASNEESASLTINNLPAGDYDFKMIIGNSWHGNGQTYLRSNASAENIGDGDNMKLTADKAGNYTFKWTYATNKLEITYPNYVDLAELASYYYVGNEVTLVLSTNLTNVSYQVKIGDGDYVAATNPYTFTAEGEHTFKVIATGDEGAAETTATVNVYNSLTVYFVNKEGWATPYIYSFSPEFHGWPGEAMIATGETTEKHGYAVYSHVVPAGANTQVIFHNNNGTQTSDLPINPAKPYRYDNEWYATLAECDPNQGVDFTGLATEIFKGTEVTFAAAATGITNPVYTFYVKEAGGEYGSAVTAYTFDAAGAYVVKVEAEGDNTTDPVVREKEITIYEHYTFHNGDIIYIDFTAVSGDVKDVNFPFGYVVTEGDPLDYDAEGAGTRKVVVFSQDVQWSTLDNFIKTAKAGWTGLKFISPAAGQNCAVVAEDGLSYTWGTHVPTLQLNGTFESTEWAATANFVLDASGEFATLEMPNLAEGSYDFKVVMEGNQWRGNGATFTRENNSGAMPNNGDNMKLTADVTGTYTFKWTYATNTLEITYPAPPVPGLETVRDGLTAGNYYTVCYDKTMTAIQGASLWSFAGKDANMAYIVEAEAPYLAGTPYLIYAESEALEAMTETVDNPVAGNNNGLYGTFSYLNAAALNAAGATHMLKNNEIRPLGNNNHLDANRAYIILSEIGEQAPAPGRRVRALPMQSNVVTGIDNGEWTNGEGANVQKIFIDGQIYILHGEKMYDATGRLVK